MKNQEKEMNPYLAATQKSIQVPHVNGRIKQQTGRGNREIGFNKNDFPALSTQAKEAEIQYNSSRIPPAAYSEQLQKSRSLDARQGATKLSSPIGKPLGLPPDDFNIQKEDFPALPGAIGRGPFSPLSNQAEFPSDRSKHNINLPARAGVANPSNGFKLLPRSDFIKSLHGSKERYGMPSLFKTLGQRRSRVSQKKEQEVSSAGQMRPIDVSNGSNLTSAEMLSLGISLEDIGLDMDASKPFKTSDSFRTPFLVGNTALKRLPRDPEFRIPKCYLESCSNVKLKQELDIRRLRLETLFYIFYRYPRDMMQLEVANELYRREWKLHKEYSMWFFDTRMYPVLKNKPDRDSLLDGMRPIITSLKGSDVNFEYIYLVPSTWEKRSVLKRLNDNVFVPKQELQQLFTSISNRKQQLGIK